MKRRNSEILIREIYPPIMQNEALQMEKELELIFNSRIKTDRRYLVGLICASIVILLLVIAFSITFIFAIIPAAFGGCCIGQALGRRWKRRKIKASAFSHEKSYEIRLTCLLIYLKSLKKRKIPLNDFQGILEKAFEDFLPAILLQIHCPKFSKIMNSLTKFLKSDSVHTSMLTAAAFLDLSITRGENPCICARRLRKFFIPVMHLLKQPVEKENQELEVVRKIGEIMMKEQTQVIICTFSVNCDRFIKVLVPFTYLSECDDGNFQCCKAISDISSATAPHLKAISPTLRLFRRNSCSELERKDKENVVLSSFEEAFPLIPEDKLGNESLVSENHMMRPLPRAFSLASPSKFDFASGDMSPIVLRKAIPVLFSKDVADYSESSDESEEDNDKNSENQSNHGESHIRRLDFESAPDKTGENFDNNIEIQFSDSEIQEKDIKIHPFIDSFEQLLSIESELNTDKIWRQVIDKPETKIFQKKAENSPICMIKAFCQVKYSAQTVYTAIWQTEIRTKWDTLFHEFRLIDKQEDYEILYYMIKTPFGITRRDWLQRRVEIHDFPEPGTIILHFVSIDHPKMPPNKGIIRAETLVSGYIIRPTSEKTCTVTIISQNDIKGLIPKALVNSVASKAPVDWVNSMNRGCKLVAGY